MKRRYVFGLGLAIAMSANWALAANIVDNGDFSQQLKHWTTSQSGRGIHTIEVLEKFEGYSGVLHLSRTDSRSDGGRQQVSQVFSTPPEECIAGTAKLTARYMVKSHSLHNSGWWARKHGDIGEYPLHFKIYSGSTCVWNLGILGYNNTEALTNYHKVPLGKWVEETIIVPLNYYSLTRADICTAGWDRDVYVDYVKLEPMD